MPTVLCRRCGKEGEAVTHAPYPSALGEMIVKSSCVQCLEEWKKFSVMVINDFKLRPFLPEHRAVLEQHMREFFKLA